MQHLILYFWNRFEVECNFWYFKQLEILFVLGALENWTSLDARKPYLAITTAATTQWNPTKTLWLLYICLVGVNIFSLTLQYNSSERCVTLLECLRMCVILLWSCTVVSRCCRRARKQREINNALSNILSTSLFFSLWSENVKSKFVSLGMNSS